MLIPLAATALSGGLRSINVKNKRNRDFSVDRRRARRAVTTKEEREEAFAAAIDVAKRYLFANFKKKFATKRDFGTRFRATF